MTYKRLRGEMPADYYAESLEGAPEIAELANQAGQAWAATVEASTERRT